MIYLIFLIIYLNMFLHYNYINYNNKISIKSKIQLYNNPYIIKLSYPNFIKNFIIYMTKIIILNWIINRMV